MEMDYNKILTDENFMEIKQHGSSDYPFQYYYDDLELFDFHCIEWHWHREFEFLYVESGQIMSIKNIFYQSFHRICLSSVFRLLNHGRQEL